MTTVQEIAPTISPGTRLPARRGDLIVRPSGNDGAHVVKDPRSGEYFRLGPEESFLLRRLDGRSMSADVCTAFERQLRQPLAPEELEQFVEMARGAGWLEDGKDATDATDMTKAPSAKAEDRKPPLAAPTKAPPAGQSILFWRKRIFDPDRLFDRLYPW